MEHTIGLRELASLIAPGTPIESMSTPEPALGEYNVVALYHSEDESRNAVLALESIESDDASLGLVDFGKEQPSADMHETDARIAGDAIPRTVKGALIGAVVTAAVVGLASLAFAANGIAVGAAIGGALLGGLIGGVWGAFLRFGGSSAYRQTFSTTVGEPTLVSLHTNDLEHAREAERLLALNADVGPETVRRTEDGLEIVRL